MQQHGYFTPDQLGDQSLAFYRENGFLVLLDALSEAEVDELNDEAIAICRGKRGMPVADRKEPQKHNRLLDPSQLESMSDEDVLKHFLCIHQAHGASPTLRKYVDHPNTVKALVQMIGPNVKCMQSMLFIKSAGKPGQAWHQDEDYIPTRDRSLTGGWIALDDATVENGCLWVIPGSHKAGVLWPQFPHDDPRFDCAAMSYDYPYDDEKDSIPVEVSRGSIVFFNGYLLHRSLPNRAKSGFRRALVNHYMSAESLLPWRYEEGKSLAQQDCRSIIMVAGKDPYAYKGTKADWGNGHIRPDGDGGCNDGREHMDLASWKKKLQKV